MSKTALTRRALLGRAAWVIPLVGLTFGRRASGADLVCVKVEKDVSFRQSQHFTEKSPDPKKTCSGCKFFRGMPTECGKCLIFDGPTNPEGHCDSWGAKA